MEIVIYILIFIMGAFIGSFASLAVHRLPLKQDILYTRSYCPNCNHKLKTIDLIPIFSYLFLRGKCRNCGQKIRPRYLILEICSGILTLVFVVSSGFNIYTTTISDIINIAFYLIFITTLVLIIGIDKEYNKLQKSVVVFGIILEIAYLCVFFDIYHLILVIILLATILLQKDNYTLQVLSVIIYTLFFIPLNIGIINLIILLILLFNKKQNTIFYYGIITIITLIISNFI